MLGMIEIKHLLIHTIGIFVVADLLYHINNMGFELLVCTTYTTPHWWNLVDIDSKNTYFPNIELLHIYCNVIFVVQISAKVAEIIISLANISPLYMHRFHNSRHSTVFTYVYNWLAHLLTHWYKPVLTHLLTKVHHKTATTIGCLTLKIVNARCNKIYLYFNVLIIICIFVACEKWSNVTGRYRIMAKWIFHQN